jgi:uncharacterized C2H2 Zn-finger protein
MEDLENVATVKGQRFKCPKCDKDYSAAKGCYNHLNSVHSTEDGRAYYTANRNKIFVEMFGHLPKRRYSQREDIEIDEDDRVLSGHIPESYEADVLEAVEKICKTEWPTVMKHRLLQALFVGGD